MITTELEKELKASKAMLMRCEKTLALLPPGKLVCYKDKLATGDATPPKEYYVYPGEDGHRKRKGVKSNRELRKKLVYKAFLEEVVEKLRANVSTLEEALAFYTPIDPVDVWNRLDYPAQEYAFEEVVPDLYQRKLLQIGGSFEHRMASHQAWAQQPYRQKEEHPESLTIKTSTGLIVRSKAEALIVEMLTRYNIPFRYEQLISVTQYEFAPDFTFQDAYGQEFYLEFCGRMDDPAYVKQYLFKRANYRIAHITEHANMIYLYAWDNDIDMTEVEDVIKHQILPRL